MMRTGIAANHGGFELKSQPTAAPADSFEESQIFRITPLLVPAVRPSVILARASLREARNPTG